MHKLTKKDSKEFKELYYKAYGILLSDEEAEKEASRLLDFMVFMLYEN